MLPTFLPSPHFLRLVIDMKNVRLAIGHSLEYTLKGELRDKEIGADWAGVNCFH